MSGRVKTAMRETPDADQPIDNFSSGAPVKTTEQVFKNIQVLKGIASSQLIPAMEFISSSLGVRCSFCHVEGHFEKDDKKPKQTARNMMKMMSSLNQNNFEGRLELTCYSCHRGARDPIATPVVASEIQTEVTVAPEVQKFLTNLPTAGQLIEGYVQALGGAAAIEKITAGQKKARSISTARSEQPKSLRELRKSKLSSATCRKAIAWPLSTGAAVGSVFRAVRLATCKIPTNKPQRPTLTCISPCTSDSCFLSCASNTRKRLVIAKRMCSFAFAKDGRP